MLEELLDFDKAVGKVLDFAINDGNTLVIVTGDHETGGYVILDGDESANIVTGGFLSDAHTATMIPVFAFGPGADEFKGVYQNTAFFKKFLEYYGISYGRSILQ
jgi:alkaline phosphatase